MSHATRLLDEEAHQRLAADDRVLQAARERRDVVLACARRFHGALRTYTSGSVSHKTVNHPVKDADCGLVLDRRTHSELGPDGNNTGPLPTVEEIRDFLRDETKLCEIYPQARLRVDRRAIKIAVYEPIDNQDPSVDLIVALDRRNGPGLWIPKAMRTGNPGWSASHPERHTELFRPSDRELRRTRTQAVRFAKAWNARYSRPYFSSHNLSAFAYWGLDEPGPMGPALRRYFEFACRDLERGLTEDPAGVSGRIPVMADTKEDALQRLRKARDLAVRADEATTEDEAREALNGLLPDQVDPPAQRAGADRLARELRRGGGGSFGVGGLAASGAATQLKSTDAYGSDATAS